MKTTARPTRLSRPEGFTLIELLAVAAIIIVLVALVLPTLRSMSTHAQQIHSLSNMKSIDAGLIAFASENQGRFPNDSTSSAWDVQVLPYLGSGNTPIFRCPLDRRQLASGFSPRSYGVSGVTINVGGWNGGRSDRPDGEGISLMQIPKPASFVLLCRISRDWEIPVNVVGSADYCAFNGPDTHNPNDPNWAIFGGKTPYAFADGHVAFFTPSQAAEVAPSEWTYDK